MPKRKDGMPKHLPGSLRAEGISSVAVDKPTRAKLKVLAGDMPVSHYIRGIVFGTIKPPQVDAQESLPGQEKTVSPATIHAAVAGISELRANTATREDYNKLELMITDIYRAMGFEKKINISENVKALASKLADLPDNYQKEMPL